MPKYTYSCFYFTYSYCSFIWGCVFPVSIYIIWYGDKHNKKGKSKTIHIFPFSSYIYQNEKSFYSFGPQTYILAVYKYLRRLLTRALPLKFQVTIFRYEFLMTGYSLSNFNHLEFHIAQFRIGFRKCFFFF